MADNGNGSSYSHDIKGSPSSSGIVHDAQHQHHQVAAPLSSILPGAAADDSNAKGKGKSPGRGAGKMHLSKSFIEQADAELLATLGYRQEFKREFSSLEVFGIAFSIMGVAPSIASTLIYSLPSGGPVSMVWGWLVGCFFISLTGLALGDLASSMPTSGGLYYWTYMLSGKEYRKFLCWTVGYANTLSTTSAVARVLLLHAILTSIGTRALARLQTVSTVLCAGLAVAICIVLGITTPSEYRNTASYAFAGWYNETGWSNVPAFLLAFLTSSWTIASYDSCVHISEEASNAAKAVPMGIFFSIVSSSILGFGIMIALAFNMGTDLAAVVNSEYGQPMATIILNSCGKTGFMVIWVFMIIVNSMMGASMNLASSRQIFAFSRDGALPFSNWVYRTNSYTLTPVNSAWWSSACSAIYCLLGLINSVAVGAVFSLSVIGASIAYVIPILARLMAPDERFMPGVWYLGDFWSKTVAWLSAIWLIFISIIVCMPSYVPVTAAADMNYACVVTAATFIFSTGWYYFPKYGGVHWFSGPKSNIDDEKVVAHEVAHQLQNEEDVKKAKTRQEELNQTIQVDEFKE
ncbi:related to UGA4-GABA permease-also involved in delta-aminolevulinate transport [Ustilago bromivora]|uniref:Related to UGA4 - GABA permease - also involved in delta-aminolevulinate transport n=1 Tax=Ustilago bromivora TaxID=307758 RepID=A0A1K0H6M1_9BASI|nr:related to UGA4-GABA permease-also involved in delta-aminolevulinate transport [Ustilago bromivora]SYW74891.1 related to UGA4 - GABA permease - also involved in delta-aminolevulinate transport [Ustilago bromivora]